MFATVTNQIAWQLEIKIHISDTFLSIKNCLRLWPSQPHFQNSRSEFGVLKESNIIVNIFMILLSITNDHYHHPPLNTA